MKKLIDWVVLSSADPRAMSLTVKGVLVALVPVIIAVLNMTGIDIDNNSLESVINSITAIVFLLGTVVSALMTVTGLMRKIITTVVGENEVLKEYKAQGK